MLLTQWGSFVRADFIGAPRTGLLSTKRPVEKPACRIIILPHRLRCFPKMQADKVTVPWNLATFIAILFLAGAIQTVKVDQYPLRSGCEPGDPVVTTLHAGDPVRIKFSLAGAAQPCYVVSAT